MVGVYLVEKPFGQMAEGDKLELDTADAEALVTAGLVREATADDLGQDDEDEDEELEDEAPDEMPESASLVTNAVKKLEKNIEASLVKATTLALKANGQRKATRPSLAKVAAEVLDKKAGFKDLGDMARCMVKAKLGNHGAQQRLMKFKGPAGASEGVNADGGYTVIPEWTDEIWDKVRSSYSLLDGVHKNTISGNTLNIPSVNETSRADGSRWGGVQSYYISEGNAFTGSKLGLTQTQLVLKKLGVFCYVTNELLSDNAYDLASYLQDKVGKEILFKTNDGCINGSGSGQPTGILNAASVVTVSKESGQSAATVVFPNLAKMWGQMYFASKPNATWIMNQEVEQQLIQQTFPNASGSYPAAGLAFNSHEEYPLRIFGRPGVVVENCPALGNAGDIILADLSQLEAIDKPMEMAISTDLKFDTDEVVYRFMYRYDVKSPWTAALTPYLGSKTVSPFVIIQGRGT